MQPLRSHLSDCQIHFSGVGDLSIWLADPHSPAADPDTDVLMVHADGDTLLPPLGDPGAAEALLSLLESFIKNHPLTQIVVTTLLPEPRSASSYADAADPMGRLAMRARWDLRVSQLAQDFQNVSALDLQILLNEAGRQSLVTDTYWYLGRIKFSALGFELLGRELERLLAGMLQSFAQDLSTRSRQHVMGRGDWRRWSRWNCARRGRRWEVLPRLSALPPASPAERGPSRNCVQERRFPRGRGVQ